MAPYVTWDEVADAVQGEERLIELLAPHADTAESHPWFDHQLRVAQRATDVDLERAGFVVPLVTVDDPLLAHAIIGRLVGLLTEASSSREPFIDALVKGAEAYFKQLREEGTSVLGGEVAAEAASSALMIGSNPNPRPIFDYEAGMSEAENVFADLGPGPSRWGWRR